MNRGQRHGWGLGLFRDLGFGPGQKVVAEWNFLAVFSLAQCSHRALLFRRVARLDIPMMPEIPAVVNRPVVRLANTVGKARLDSLGGPPNVLGSAEMNSSLMVAGMVVMKTEPDQS